MRRFVFASLLTMTLGQGILFADDPAPALDIAARIQAADTSWNRNRLSADLVPFDGAMLAMNEAILRYSFGSDSFRQPSLARSPFISTKGTRV